MPRFRAPATVKQLLRAVRRGVTLNHLKVMHAGKKCTDCQ